MSVRYEVEEGTNAVRVFFNDSDVPSLYQPDYPNAEPWESFEAAELWAKQYVASIEDETAPYAPIGPGIPGEPKPTPEQIAEWKAQNLLPYSPSE